MLFRSRGIGQAIARAYAREGAKLALCARSATELDQTVKELRALDREAEGWICDVSLEEPVKDFIAGVHKKFGRIDILVNNAGVMTRPTSMTELDIKKWDYTIAVNLRGPFLAKIGCQASLIDIFSEQQNSNKVCLTLFLFLDRKSVV